MKKYIVKRDKYQWILCLDKGVRKDGGDAHEAVGYYYRIEDLLRGARERLLKDKTKSGVELASLIERLEEKNGEVLDAMQAMQDGIVAAARDAGVL